VKKKTKILVAIFSLLIALLIVSIIYFFINDLESFPTEEIKQVCALKEEMYNGRKVFIINAKGQEQQLEQDNKKYILYFHGGSYMAEVSKLHWDFLQSLAIDTNATIIVPDYPLTPKYNYTDVFKMIEPLYKQIIQQIDTKNLIVMGDSAGGGMALALCEKIGEQDLQQPNKLILISPWLDVRLENPKIAQVEKHDKQLNRKALQLAGIAYIGENESSYLVNPIDGNLEKLKSVIIYTGTYDILNPDVHILQEKAKNIELEIDVREYEKEAHIWLLDRSSKKTEQAENAYQDLIHEIINT